MVLGMAPKAGSAVGEAGQLIDNRMFPMHMCRPRVITRQAGTTQGTGLWL